MGPRGVFVGEKVRLPDWYDPPEVMLDAPVVAEVLTEHRAFSTHTLAKVCRGRWRNRKAEARRARGLCSASRI
jgi:hypothetical protein